jgi:polyisoprenyl-teichoic acid--peptidoglycan teichoic acid transferase
MRRRIALASLAFASWIAGSTIGTVTPTESAAAQPLLQIEQAHAGYVPSLDGSKPIFILFIGSGARPGEDVQHSLADSIHIVSIVPDKHKAAILGIPRDSYVSIPDRGSAKINSAMVYGGPELLVQTVESVTGIKLDYWALTTFWGFQAMINSIGGLTVDVPFPMQDSASGSNFQPGVQKLRGKEALAFARDRHSLPAGDFGRTEDGGRLIVAALTQFRKEFRKDPSRLLTWIAGGFRNVQSQAPLEEVLSLAFTCTLINPKRVENVVAPGTTSMAGSTSIVNLSSQAQTIFDDMAKDGLVSKRNIPPSPNASLLGG